MSSRMVPLLSMLKFSADGATDSFLTLLHYKYIRNFFIGAFTLSLTRQLFGDNIICHAMKQDISQHLLETNCFINGTFSKNAEGDVVHHNYYQWISIILMFEAFCFYLPYHVWYKFCGLFLKNLQHVKDEESFKKVIKTIELSHGYKIFWKTRFLELFYFVHLIAQACLVNHFLNRGFSYPWNSNAVNVMFPDYGNCNFDYYSGGFMTTGKFICLLPLNVLYRKVFSIASIGFWIVVPFHVFYFTYQVTWGLTKGRRKNIDTLYAYRLASRFADDFQFRILLKNKMRIAEDASAFV